MRTGKRRGLWRKTRERIRRFFEDLKKDSISRYTGKPFDCCNPPETGKNGERKD